ncbi:MAG: hypothetical protein ABIR68_13645 [Ilumatobacteraceae bacterium]
MPWCEDCAKYHAPSAMNADGTCPTCGRVLERTQSEPRRRKRSAAAVPTETDATDPDAIETANGTEHVPITAKNINLRKLAAGEDGDEADMKAPWHFKLLLVLLAIYLTWRVVQLFM